MEASPSQSSWLFFLRVGKYEGISYIILLFIAMPLKYYFEFPQAVRIVGSLHGILFVAFCYAIVRAMQHCGLTFKQAVLAFIASLVPFGTFFLDRMITSPR